jgi:hypothetical protein
MLESIEETYLYGYMRADATKKMNKAILEEEEEFVLH